MTFDSRMRVERPSNRSRIVVESIHPGISVPCITRFNRHLVTVNIPLEFELSGNCGICSWTDPTTGRTRWTPQPNKRETFINDSFNTCQYYKGPRKKPAPYSHYRSKFGRSRPKGLIMCTWGGAKFGNPGVPLLWIGECSWFPEIHGLPCRI